jgi:stage II sporulation protein D
MKSCSAAVLCAFVFVFCAPAWGRTVGFDPAPLKASAAEYLDEGRFLECVEAYRQVAEYSHDPEDKSFGLVRMGDVLALFLDRKARALEIYDQAVRSYPGTRALENAYFNTGMVAYELGRLDLAEQGFSGYLRIFPSGARAFTAEYMLDRVKQEALEQKKPLPPETKAEPEPAAPGGDEPMIRVVLDSGSDVRLVLDSPAGVRFGSQNEQWPAGEYAFALRNGRVHFQSRQLGREIILVPGGGCCFSVGKKHYAGEAVVLAHEGKLLLINRLGMETYLQGVVPREMSPSWDLEALKSQAVAARSYALYLALKSQDKPYDVAATTASQVYGGADAGNERTRQAVSSTRGQILEYDDSPVLSYFHAHSGGMLEDSSQVWTTAMPYYQVREDPVSQSFKPLDWEARISKVEVAKALKKNGFDVSSVSGIEPQEVSPSGRWSKVRILTDSGPVVVRSNSLRIWLGATKIKSTLCDVQDLGRELVLSGRGYGHGVGMSQWGAQGMASGGQGYRQVLQHYYPGTTIARAY